MTFPTKEILYLFEIEHIFTAQMDRDRFDIGGIGSRASDPQVGTSCGKV